MSTPAGTNENEDVAQPPADNPPVTVHRTSPDRMVFTEADNHDGWIATDLAVDLER